MPEKEQRTLYVVLQKERHYGINIYGITDKVEWANAWIIRDGGPSDTLSGPDIKEFLLNDPKVFPEVRSQEGGNE